MLTVEQVADYFLKKTKPEFGDSISNLKLQKLVYYAQGFHFAMYKAPLFKESILAWEHGPVVEALYHKYKDYGAGELPQPESVDPSNYQAQEIELLDEVYEIYGQFSAWKLRNMTHSELPWIATPKNAEIKPELMVEFFSTLLN